MYFVLQNTYSWQLEYLTRLTTGKQPAQYSQHHVSSPINRIALAPPFPGLCQFKQGQNFTQWTADNSKALMKVHMSSQGCCHMLTCRVIGLHECDPVICPPLNCQDICHIPWIFVHHMPQYHYRRCAQPTCYHTPKIPCCMSSLLRDSSIRRSFSILTPLPTCHGSLFRPHRELWLPK